MDEYLELNLIGRIQSLLINLHRQGEDARPQMLWLLLGMIEAGLQVQQLTQAEYTDMRGMTGEMLCFSRGGL